MRGCGRGAFMRGALPAPTVQLLLSFGQNCFRKPPLSYLMAWRILRVIFLNFKKQFTNLHRKHNPNFAKMPYSVNQKKTGEKHINFVASGIMGDLSSLCPFLSVFPKISTKTL